VLDVSDSIVSPGLRLSAMLHKRASGMLFCCAACCCRSRCHSHGATSRMASGCGLHDTTHCEHLVGMCL
jgi:hypothetical protein